MRTYFFVDEAGNFDFSLKSGASKYLILTSVSMESCHAADGLLALRRQLSWEGAGLTGAFHATTDKQSVRDRVFSEIVDMDIQIDTTIFEKRKTVLHRQSEEGMYKLAWFKHASNVIPRFLSKDHELHVVAASIGTKKGRARAASGVNDVINQCGRTAPTVVSHWPADSDPCLQVADYCCWAIQRKWERNDERSYELIKSLIRSEYDYFHHGSTYYY